MRPTPRPRPARARRGLLAALALAFLFGLWRAGGGDPATDRLEHALLDLRFQLRGSWDPSRHVAIVTVGEPELGRFGNAASLRAALADAVPRILASGATSVAVDLLLVDQTPADRELALALGRDRRTLLAVAALNEASDGEPAPPEVETALDRSAIPVVVGPPSPGPGPKLLLPASMLAGSAGLAHVNILRAPDGAARAMPLVLDAGEGRVLPALPLAAAALAEGWTLRLVRGERIETGRHAIPLGTGGALVIDHPGRPEGMRLHALLDVLEGRTAPEAFRGRIVFVGATAESLGDTFVTPFGANVAGVEVLAGVAAGLVEGRHLARNGETAALSVLLAVLASAAAFGAVRARGRRLPAAALAAVWVTVLLALQAAFSEAGLWLDAVSVVAGLAAGTLAGGALRYRRATQRAGEMERQRGNLARFVAPALADRLAREGIPAFHGREQQAAVLFVDVEGFTTLSETAAPAATADFLKRLHAHFEDAGARHGGIVVDYQGDGAMIAFGLPDPAPDDAARALACAGDLLACTGDLQAAAPDGRAPRLRVSVHHGPATAAVLGGSRQAVVTLTGDTVNLAARLQETAKAFGVALVVTREALSAAGAADDPAYVLLTRTRVRGREAETEVWTRRPAA